MIAGLARELTECRTALAALAALARDIEVAARFSNAGPRAQGRIAELADAIVAIDDLEIGSAEDLAMLVAEILSVRAVIDEARRQLAPALRRARARGGRAARP